MIWHKNDLWKEFASLRSYVAGTPHEEVAAVIMRKRRALAKDSVKQITSSSNSYENSGPWTSLHPPDNLLPELAYILVSARSSGKLYAWGCLQEVACLVDSLDVST
jgi:hypothetical protein